MTALLGQSAKAKERTVSPMLDALVTSGMPQFIDVDRATRGGVSSELYQGGGPAIAAAAPTLAPRLRWRCPHIHNEVLHDVLTRGHVVVMSGPSDSAGTIDEGRLYWAYTNSFQLGLYGFELPGELSPFVQEIERSRAMLDLEDDWDGEGSPGYAEETWRRAVGIAIAGARNYLTTRKAAPPTPVFSKGPEGSVDILWWSGNRRLMINVPAEENDPVTYHGYDRENANRETKGVLDPYDSNGWMLSWLTE